MAAKGKWGRRAGEVRCITVLRTQEFTDLVRRAADELVHPSATKDRLVAARHRSFILANLVGGFAALAAFPLYLAWKGPMAWSQVLIFAFLVAQVGLAAFLSRTGRFAIAHLLSALFFTNLIGWVAAFSGGLHSFALAWLVVVPIEAALSGSRRVVAAAIAFVLAAIGLLAAAGSAGAIPASLTLPLASEGMMLLSMAAAVAYAGVLALRVEGLHRKGEAIARAGEARYRLLADNVTDVITRHGGNGDVVFASSAASRVFGIGPRDLEGTGFLRRVHVADRPAYLKALSQALHEQRETTVEFRIRFDVGGDGEHRDAPGAAPTFLWVEMRCRPLPKDHDDNGAPGNVVAAIRDISALKAHERDLEVAREAAEHASQAKTRFLANVSHELRTPLNAIIGFSDILKQEMFGGFEDPRQREYVGLIHESGEHLLQVVNSILDMSKIEAGTFQIVAEPFDLGATVESCRQMMARTAEERQVTLVAELPGGTTELNADRRACKQILLNLMSNALKFTDPGDRVSVGVRRESETLALYVRDTGIGISKDDLPRLGTPFMQAESAYDRKFEGTGLGLSVVKGLAELHGGSFEIESELGAGTCVTIRFPLHHESTDGHAAEPGEAVSASKVRHLKRA